VRHPRPSVSGALVSAPVNSASQKIRGRATTHPHETRDLIVVYDVLRKAANRLVARDPGRRPADGLSASDAAAIGAIRDRVDAVDPVDQRATAYYCVSSVVDSLRDRRRTRPQPRIVANRSIRLVTGASRSRLDAPASPAVARSSISSSSTSSI
jgi:hypothetical protein